MAALGVGVGFAEELGQRCAAGGEAGDLGVEVVDLFGDHAGEDVVAGARPSGLAALAVEDNLDESRRDTGAREVSDRDDLVQIGFGVVAVPVGVSSRLEESLGFVVAQHSGRDCTALGYLTDPHPLISLAWDLGHQA